MISIIIPTYNRGFNLRKTLTALSKQTYKDFEIIISDDNSNDGTIGLINEFKDVFPKLKYVYSNVRPQWDCARPRNIAIGLSKGDLIIILDSDIVLEEKALSYYAEDFKSFPDRIILGRYDWLNTNQIPEMNILMQDIHTLLDKKELLAIPEYRKIPFENNRPEGLFYSYPHAVNCLGGNIGIPKKVFENVGLFDEEMAMVEDGDFGIRSWKKQIPKSYDNRIRGWHLAHEIDPVRNLKAGEQLKKLNLKHFGQESATIDWIVGNRTKFLEVPEVDDKP